MASLTTSPPGYVTNEFYKTKMCNKGRFCKHKSSCHFAHNPHELSTVENNRKKTVSYVLKLHTKTNTLYKHLEASKNTHIFLNNKCTELHKKQTENDKIMFAINQITTNYIQEYTQKCLNKRSELEKEKEHLILSGYDPNFNIWIPNVPTTCPICAEDKSDDFVYCNHCSAHNKDRAVCISCFIKMKDQYIHTSRIIEVDLAISFELQECICGKLECPYFKYKLHSLKEINKYVRKPVSEFERTSISLVNNTVLKSENDNIYHSKHKLNIHFHNLFSLYQCMVRCPDKKNNNQITWDV